MSHPRCCAIFHSLLSVALDPPWDRPPHLRTHDAPEPASVSPHSLLISFSLPITRPTHSDECLTGPANSHGRIARHWPRGGAGAVACRRAGGRGGQERDGLEGAAGLDPLGGGGVQGGGSAGCDGRQVRCAQGGRGGGGSGGRRGPVGPDRHSDQQRIRAVVARHCRHAVEAVRPDAGGERARNLYVHPRLVRSPFRCRAARV